MPPIPRRSKHWGASSVWRDGRARSSLLCEFFLRRAHANWDERADLITSYFASAALDPSLPADDLRSRQLRGPDFDPSTESVLEACAENWAAGSLSLNAVCDARGIEYLQVLQPALDLPGSKPRSEQERALVTSDTWKEAGAHGYPLLRERFPALRTAGVDVLDGTQVFADVDETLYVDGCHFNDEGQGRLADYLADALLESLLR